MFRTIINRIFATPTALTYQPSVSYVPLPDLIPPEQQDAWNAFAKTLKTLTDQLLALAEKSAEEEARKPRLSMSGWSIPFSNKNLLLFHFEFKYDVSDRIHSLLLPVYTNLAENRLWHPEAPDLAPTVSVKPRWQETIISVVYHPILKWLGGFGAALSLVALSGLFPPLSLAMGFTAPIVLLASSLVSLLPSVHMFCKRKYEDLRSRALAYLSDALDDIAKDDLTSVYHKTTFLPWYVRLLIHDYMPGNHDIKWSFFYIRDACQFGSDEYVHRYYLHHLRTEYLKDYSHTPDQHLLVCRTQILRAYEDCEHAQRMQWKHPYGSPQHKECLDSIQSYQLRAKLFGSQIPLDAPLYKDYGLEIHEQLDECIELFRQNTGISVKKAIDAFERIQWDGFLQEAYPAAAIVYNQLKYICAIASYKFKRTQGEYLELNGYRDLLWRVKDVVDYANSMVQRHFYPRYAPDMSNAVKRFEELERELFENPEYKKLKPKPVTPIHELFKKRAEQQKPAEEQQQQLVVYSARKSPPPPL